MINLYEIGLMMEIDMSRYENTEDYYYSLIYGHGIYKWNQESIADPFRDNANGDEFTPVLMNRLTKEKFFLRRIESDNSEVLNYYKQMVLVPPSRKKYFWPCDIIQLNDYQSNICTVFVEQQYTANPVEPRYRKGQYALLFPLLELEHMKNGIKKIAEIKHINSKKIEVVAAYEVMAKKDLLYDIEGWQTTIAVKQSKYNAEIPSFCLNWKNPEVKKMAIEIVKSIRDLNQQGYLYFDMHLSRFFFKENGEVYLDFSQLLTFNQDKWHSVDLQNDYLTQQLFPVEFAEPAIINQVGNNPDYQTQNYSLTALLFYLFFNCYAYDGRTLEGKADNTVSNHYIRFQLYHKIAKFIFDDEDKENKLSAFDYNEAVMQLWREFPGQLKEKFIYTFKQENAMREKVNLYSPTPDDWLNCFHQLGWM